MGQNMEIQTSNFGTQTVNADDILSFPNGLIGLETHTQFKLFHEESDNPTVYWLQSTSDSTLLMSVVTPAAFGLNYEINLSDDEQQLLKLENTEDAIVLVIIYKKYELNDDAKNLDMKAISEAPIIINTKDKLGLQKALTKLDVIN